MSVATGAGREAERPGTDLSLGDERSPATLERELERHRQELTRHCVHMLGSNLEAEDAVQDTLVRAWRSRSGLERPTALRGWLYRIATNVCLDMLGRRARRQQLVELEPLPGDAVPGDAPLDDPAEVADRREAVRLALVAALRHLPPRQRAALLLCEVLRLRASEAAEVLGTSVASVTSALQRARATLAARGVSAADTPSPLEGAASELLGRYLDAFGRDDVRGLVSLINEDVGRSSLARAAAANQASEVPYRGAFLPRRLATSRPGTGDRSAARPGQGRCARARSADRLPRRRAGAQ
jgi:RNA polymerase sigma-70 factor (ECF subfamily)